MSITLEKTIVHILNSTDAAPIFSDVPFSLNADTKNYLLKTIEKTFQSDDVKTCLFKPESNVWNQCRDISWDVVSISQSIANEIFNIMRRNREIPAADLLFGLAQIEGSRYFYMLKFDYRSALTHLVETVNNQISVSIIQHRALFPAQAPKVTEGFFIDIESPTVKVIEHKYAVDGIKDFYLSTQILCCTENKSPRQKTTKLLKVAEKVADLYYTGEDEMDAHISSTMYEELQKGQSLSVKNLGQKFFSQNPAAQEEFFERLSTADISRDDELSLSEKFQKKFQKQAIRTSSGVEIKIPTQVYSNVDEIEFINNPDGTVSLLIKNIRI
ncbi:MAG: nucleoid-associated protein [Roseburia sp.]